MKFFGITFCIWGFCCIILISGSDIAVDYKIYDIYTDNQFEKEMLLRLQQYEEYDFFKLPRAINAPARVRVSLQNITDFEAMLYHFKLNFNDVPDTANVETLSLLPRASVEISSLISFSKFQRYAAIDEYLNILTQKYPRRASVRVIGRSYEGRNLKVITVSNGDGRQNKNVILVDGGIHAREWIAPAGVLYILYQLVENYATNADLLKDYDWVIFPLVNPDGYEYTHTKDRMWRKTRQPVKYFCVGTDANRNFGFHWGQVGASSSCNSEIFKGKKAFSEPETKALRNLMHELRGRAKFYLTLHAYGNYLLYPWGYSNALPDNWRDIDEVAQAGAAAIRTATGTSYTVGSSTNVLYAAAGGSDDYALGVVGIPISITMELPAGGSGFDPQPSQILPFVKETWVGVRAMAQQVIKKY